MKERMQALILARLYDEPTGVAGVALVKHLSEFQDDPEFNRVLHEVLEEQNSRGNLFQNGERQWVLTPRCRKQLDASLPSVADRIHAIQAAPAPN